MSFGFNVGASSGAELEEGLYEATLYGVVNVGLQPSQLYAPKEQIVFLWEFVGTHVSDTDDRPIGKSRKYTNSLHPKSNLTEFLTRWLKKPVDAIAKIPPSKLIGRQAQILIASYTKGDGSTGTGISKVLHPKGPNGLNPVATVNKPLYYDVEEHDAEAYERMPGWLKEVVDGRITEASASAAKSERDLFGIDSELMDALTSDKPAGELSADELDDTPF